MLSSDDIDPGSKRHSQVAFVNLRLKYDIGNPQVEVQCVEFLVTSEAR